MFKYIILFCLCLSSAVLASVNDDLYKKLSSFDALKANFEQKVLDSTQKEIATSLGTIAIDKKSLGFLMHTYEPDETVIMYKDDGVYLYDSFLNQVNIYNKDGFNKSPFALINIKDKKELDLYTIDFKDNCFILSPKQINSDIKSFSLAFNGSLIIEVKAFMQSGDINIYTLSNVQNSVEPSDLKYTIPTDAEVSDDR